MNHKRPGSEELWRRFDAALAALKSEFHLNQNEIAAEIDIDEGSLSKFQKTSGARLPSLETVEKLENLLNDLRSNQAEKVSSPRWSDLQGNVSKDEKRVMALHFGRNEFLLGHHAEPRINNVASILVAPGTTTQRVVEETMNLIGLLDRQSSVHVQAEQPIRIDMTPKQR